MNNIFYSTRSDSNPISSYETIIKGIADDGGLFMLKELPKISIDNIENFNFTDISKLILSNFLIDWSTNEIDFCVKNSFNDINFDTKEITPLKQVGNKYVLELFHGRTCAFKDIALSILPYLMTTAKKKVNKNENLN